ncbi:MAG: hypothetical protein U0746_13330 [Gemmataceae bacterium]
MPLQNVHIRINDAATGQPTPVRLRVTDSAGNYYAPFGHFNAFPVGPGEAVNGDVVIDHNRWAVIDGACEIALPAGELTIQATKGPEYTPLNETASLPPGKMALRFTISRTNDLPAEGWYGGDARCHEPSPHAAGLEAASEGLAVVHLLATERALLAADGNSYWCAPHLTAYSAQGSSLESHGSAICVGTANGHPHLGMLALLHTHRIVYPLSFGGSDATDDWSLEDWCGQAHRKGGLVVWVDAGGLRRGQGSEALANAILGEVDAVELADDVPATLEVWKLLANAGVVLPLVGASAKDSNRTPLGAWRTYARLPAGEPFSLGGWIDAVRAGRTYVTAGPLVRFAVDGRVAHAEAFGHAAIDAVEIVRDETVVGRGPMACDATFDDGRGGWVAARGWRQGKLVAHTSAVRLDGPRETLAVAPLLRHLDAGREWVETVGRFDNPKARDHLLSVFEAATQKLHDLSR